MADGFVQVAVRHNAYVDSVTLLQVSSEVLALTGVLDAGLVMGTELNRDVLRDAGLLIEAAETAGPNDLLIAVRASDEALAGSTIERAEALLARRRSPRTGGDGLVAAMLPRSLRSAHRANLDATLALVSVPGPFAANEARQALSDGLHVFLFSDNVPLEDEVELKHLAREKHLLLMGPDCGTAILNGIGLGFANVVRRGRIGLIGASGTGLQEVTSLLHQAGQGISHAIGTGGRDLYEAVGGSTTLQALALLRDDPHTETIVLVSKPSGASVAQRILSAAVDTGKPVVACLLGAQLDDRAGVQMANNLYQAARLASSPDATWSVSPSEHLPCVRLRADQRQVRGLFCGGTLCQEAASVVRDTGCTDVQFVDFGDDRYTQGRAHPMIDPSLRNHAIVEAGADPRVAVLLLDVLLGLGSHADPAGATIPAIRRAMASALADGRELACVAHVVGTDRDPQGLSQQEAALRSAGVHVVESNYHAAVAAGLLAGGATS